MKIAIAGPQDLFIEGGAQYHLDNLAASLKNQGHQVVRIEVPFRWHVKEELVSQAVQWSMIDIHKTGVDLTITTRFPSFYINAPRKVSWILHQHRPVYELYGTEYSPFSDDNPGDRAIQEAVHKWDRHFLEKHKALFANSHNVASRLKRFNDLEATPLYHPPPGFERFYSGQPEDFVLMPSRLVPHKRPGLLLDVIAKTKSPVKGVIIGEGPMHDELVRCAAEYQILDRIVFLGHIGHTDPRKFKLYSQALATFVPPFDECLGYIPLEGFLAQKPCITFADSGGPTFFVQNGVNGAVAESVEQAASAIDDYYWNKARAREHGANGLQTYRSNVRSWSEVCEILTASQ